MTDFKPSSGIERISTGIGGLDDVLNGGFLQGHVFLVEGEPGTGKTTLGLQFLLAGAQAGEKVLYVTLSESKRDLEGVAASHGWSLAAVRIFEYTPTEDSLREEGQYSVFHPAEVEFHDTTRSILNEVDRVQPTRVVLDSLSDIRLLARDTLRYRRQVLALKNFFTNRNCTVILLDERPAADSQDVQLESIAHGVVLLERLPRSYGKPRRRLEIVKLRSSVFRDGFHDYSIETGGLVVYPRLIAAEHRGGFEKGCVSSGIPGLDRLWGEGLDRGSSTLVLGPAGCGKSTIVASYVAEAARRGESSTMFLFDEFVRSVLTRTERLGNDLGPYVAAGTVAIQQVDPAELSLGEFVHLVRQAVDEKGARMVVIDSLNGYLNAMPGEGHLALQMHQLLSFLGQRGVVTLLVLAQRGVVGSVASPVDLSYLADNILLLRYFESAGCVCKAVSVLKKRNGSHEDTIRELHLADGKISVGEPLKHFRGILSGVPIMTGSTVMEAGEGNGRE